MKLLNLKTAGLGVLLIIASCSTSKQDQLTALKKEHDAIAEKIKTLEAEIAASDTSNANNEALALKVATKVMTPTVFNHFIEVQGRLDGEENLGVSAKMPGTVESVNVSMGDKVTKGQILAKLDDAVLQQNMKQLKDNLGFVTELYNKQKALWDQKIGSEVQYLSAKNNKESLENSIKTLQDQIDMMRIVSPINGTVEDISIKIGQSVGPGLPIFRVVNFSSMKVVAEIAESYSSRVNKGDEVIVRFPDLNRDITARISSASKYIGPQNRTFDVEVKMKPEFNNFKANMIAILKINDYRAEKAMVLPINLIQNDQQGSFVFIAVKDKDSYRAHKAPVKAGQSYNGLVEITSGLKEGDILITAGQLDLQDGQTIRL
ncbi:MAG: efflux RND transporter periplasmic adaptor subunit [Bacteroidales bacterium]|nr:efflux RND transporter periplasmic adaptor subunit [Bacteroidales bacterium]MCB9000205.1 efflux RND transporter periplasmic adaptor subunit [Bacteroidales bacterium]MCB9013716.1 efflux RND transporter periplasmic adaptor subunit [Bacteroidales bacterium]